MPRLGSGVALVGRSAHLGLLRDTLERARRGAAGALLLSGDAGVGKTRLISEFGQAAAADGAHVLVGRCLDLRDGGLPYLPFVEALTPLAESVEAPVRSALASRSALTRLIPQLGEPAPDPVHAHPSGTDHDAWERLHHEHDLGELQLFDAVLGVLGDLATHAPVVLVLEDLHWADSSTRNLLAFLCSRLRTQPLLIVGSYREEDIHRRHPLRALLAELVRLPVVERLDLPPLERGDAWEFVQALAEEHMAPGRIADIVERSQGNPFFVEELLAASADTCSDLPAGLAEVLLSRLERMPALTQQVLRVISVADGGVSHSALTEVTDLSEAELDEALREAIAHHVLVLDGSHYAFRHALLQEAVYGDLLPGERSRLHRAYAARLQAQPPRRGRDAFLAYHSMQSNDLVTALAALHRAAGEAARSGAPAAALEHLEQMLQVWDAVPVQERPEGVDELGLLVDASHFAGTSGEPERAVAYGRLAVELLEDSAPDPRAAATWHRLVQACMALENTWSEAVEASERAWDLVRDAPVDANRAWVLATRATILRALDRRDEARESAEAAVTDARVAGSGGAEADALITLAGLAEGEGRIDPARQLLESARRKAADAGELAVELRARYFLALSYNDDGDLPNALRYYRAGIDHAAATGLTWSSLGVELRAQHLYLRYVSGDWPTAPATGSPRWGVSGAVAARLAAGWASIVTARGRFAEAERLVAELRRQWRVDAGNAQAAGAVGAELAFWQGEDRRAAQRAHEAVGWLQEVEPWLLGGIRLSALGVAAAARWAAAARARGDQADLAAAVDLGEDLLGHGQACLRHGRPRSGDLGPEGRAWAARLEAAASGLQGPADPALWGAAVEGFSYGAVYEQAVCRWMQAATLLESDPASAAHAGRLLRAAYETADELGAEPLRDAVVGLARRARIGLPGRSVEPSAADVFTSRERDVLERVALGRTNRQVGEDLFISAKTVSVHLSRVMAKLGATRRSEAVAIAYDRGLLSRPGARPG